MTHYNSETLFCEKKKNVTLGLLDILDMSLTVNTSGSLISGLLEKINTGSSSVPELTTERVTVKLLQGKIYANMSVTPKELQ